MLKRRRKPKSHIFFKWNLCTIAFFCILLCSSYINHAQSLTATGAEISGIEFKVKNFGINVEGTFEESLIDLKIDTLSLNQSFIKAQIFVKSISTGIKKRDEHLKASKYFNEDEYPLILFESTDISKMDDQSFVANGMITIKGVQKLIELPFEICTKSGKKMLMSKFELNRLDFEVGSENWTLGDIVKIDVSYDFKN